LATYTSLLLIFYPGTQLGQKTKILPQIINEVELMAKSEQGLEWRDGNDSFFFKIAMEKCFFFADDFNLIKQLHSTLILNDNIKFLNNFNNWNKYL
jgi:hypothetical protein